ncbi:MAG: hypothetical protein S4CHLAM7_00670 [Chlamydiae bacterium]|nr:hypothetical protein [Chlamydiota bacterium]
MNYLIRILFCIITFGSFLYLYVDKLNAHTELRLQIPALSKEIDQINQSSVHLSYQIECFKNPQNLMQLAKMPEYSHLKFPYTHDILLVTSRIAQQASSFDEAVDKQKSNRPLKLPIFLGTK